MSTQGGTLASGPSTDGLVRLGQQLPLRRYVGDLWQRREFAIAVPLGDLRAQNMDTVLGNLWHLLNPMLLVGVYYLVFGLVLGTRRGIDDFLSFLAIGVFTFHYSQKSVIAGAKSIVSNEGLIRSIQFPRAILPISTVIGQTVSYLPALALMLVVALSDGVRPGAGWLLVVPIMALQALFNLGSVFVVARLTDGFRDLENVLPFVFRILFYLSGTLYEVSRYVPDAALARLFYLNPLYAFITIMRAAVRGGPLEAAGIVSVVVWTVALLAGGFSYFRSGEGSYGRA